MKRERNKITQEKKRREIKTKKFHVCFADHEEEEEEDHEAGKIQVEEGKKS